MGNTPRGYALRLIKRRLHSRAELEAALAKRGVESEEIRGVLRELAEAGLVDDVRLAHAWVHDRDRFQPRGEWLLKQELRKKGIPEEIIQDALRSRHTGEEPVDVAAQARSLVEGRLRQYAHLPKEVQTRRLTAFLLRKGFSLDVVRRIVGEIYN